MEKSVKISEMFQLFRRLFKMIQSCPYDLGRREDQQQREPRPEGGPGAVGHDTPAIAAEPEPPGVAVDLIFQVLKIVKISFLAKAF